MVHRITLADIAREAGVSKQTVSRVINNNPDVARSTRKRVQVIIDRLGYQPNAIARSLSSHQTYTIGLVISYLDYYGAQSVLVSIQRGAREAGYDLLPYLLHDEDPSEDESHLRALVARQPDAIIWAVPHSWGDNITIHDQQILSTIPIVTMNEYVFGVPSILEVSNEDGARSVVNHLIEEGYRHIGVITGPPNWQVSKKRLSGWQHALMASGLAAGPDQIVEGDWSAESGRQGAARLLTQYPEIDAIFACNDQMALGALSLLHQKGLRIPQEIGIAGYDDIPESEFFTPSLTTVQQPYAMCGTKLVEAVVAMIEENTRDGAFTIPETVTLCPEIVIRQSSRRSET
jgi:LacI family transcriptional regulator